MADQCMACHNLPTAMMKHWAYVHKLNGYLIELVRSSSIGYRVANFPLNPLAPEHMPQSMKNNQEGHNMRNIQLNSTSSKSQGDMFGNMGDHCQMQLTGM